jgi:hypothetical protein
MDQTLGKADPMGEMIRRILHELEDVKCRVQSVEEEQHPDRWLRALDQVWDKIPEKSLTAQFEEMCADHWTPCPEENKGGEGI